MIRPRFQAFSTVVCAVLMLFSAPLIYSKVGCANQTCSLNTDHYECSSGAGQLCTNQGSECTSSICGGNALRASLLVMPPGVTAHPDPQLAEIIASCSGPRSTKATAEWRPNAALLDISLDQSGGRSSAKTGTSMRLLLPSEKVPLVLMIANHGVDDAMTGGKVMSYASKPIVSYRVGWLYGWGSKSLLEQGRLIPVKGGIQPGFSSDVPAQYVSPNKGAERPQVIGLFISEVRYADGSSWKADKKLFASQLN